MSSLSIPTSRQTTGHKTNVECIGFPLINTELTSWLIQLCTDIKHTEMPQLVGDDPGRLALGFPGLPRGMDPVTNGSDFVPSSCLLESLPKETTVWSPSFRLFFGEPKLKLHMCVVEVWVTQSCPTLCDPMDYSLPGSSVHGILQARILQWVAIPFSRGTSQPQGSNPGLQHCRQILYCLNHREVHICVHVS